MLATHAGALVPHPPPPPDPAVVLLIHPDEEGGIVDRSQYAHALTNEGVTYDGLNPPPSNDLSMIGDNIVTDGLVAQSSINFARAAGEPFTIEASINIDPEMPALTSAYFLAWDDGRYHVITPLGGGLFRVTYNDGTGYSYGDLSSGVWYRIAVSYDGTVFRLFLNGALVATSGSVLTAALTGAREYGVIGVPSRGDLRRFLGRMAEVRLTLGEARYTASYTPSSTPFPNPSAP